MDAVNSFGAWVQHRRRSLRLTQHELAEMVGCSAVLIRKIEADERRPSAQVAARLARSLALAEEHHAAFVRSARAEKATFRLSVPSHPDHPHAPRHSATARYVLPAFPSELLGRQQDVAAIERLLRGGARLVTLVGPPGVGKTRLALAAAQAVSDRFSNGAVFVQLAPINNPAHVISAIAQALDVRETPMRSTDTILTAMLIRSNILLVLDNCEHLLDAALAVSALLSAAAGVSVLATSRAPFHISGEQIYPVAPLDEMAAVALFTARAQAIAPSFRLTEVTQPAVAAICRRLDRLPLVIELAAARVRLFSPQALLVRLEAGGLRELRDGPRDLPDRQRTLRDAIAWSYRILSTAEQALFRRLGVFVGGFTVAMVAAVAELGADDALERLAALLDQQMIVLVEGADDQPRFMLLETLHEFALDQLVATGEADKTSLRHAEYMLQLAEQSSSALLGPEQFAWGKRLIAEIDNFRAALSWTLGHWQASHQSGANEPLGVQLVAALGEFWSYNGAYTEARHWQTHALARSDGAHALARARLLRALALAFHEQDENDPAIAFVHEGIELARLHNDSIELGRALWIAAIIRRKQGNADESQRLASESRIHFARHGYLNGLAWVCFLDGLLHMDRGESHQADEKLHEAVRLFEQAGNTQDAHWVHTNLGQNARFRGELDLAERHYRIALTTMRAINNRALAAVVVSFTGHLALARGDYAAAEAIYREAFAELQLIGNRRHIADCLDGMAVILTARGTARTGARLMGAAARIRETIQVPLAPAEAPIAVKRIAIVRAALDDASFEEARREGQVLSWEAAVAEALA